MLNLKIIGHRGYGPRSVNRDDTYPENTLLSFNYALSQGADGIELDIFMSKDGIPIVIHDERLYDHVIPEQVSLVKNKAVTDYTFSELQQFDVGHQERIPSLDQVFELMTQFKDRRILNLDVKDPQTVQGIVAVISEYRKSDFKHEIIISSYNWEILKEFRKLDEKLLLVPAIKTAILFGPENVSSKNYQPLTDTYQPNFKDPILALHKDIQCYAFDCAMPDFNFAIIEFALQYKVGLQFSTGNSRISADETDYTILQQLRQSLDLGLPFVICKVDEPDLVKEKLQKIKI